jgi:hypothetical protein
MIGSKRDLGFDRKLISSNGLIFVGLISTSGVSNWRKVVILQENLVHSFYKCFQKGLINLLQLGYQIVKPY